MGKEIKFIVLLKNGEIRETEYRQIVHTFALIDDFFMGESLKEPTLENALYVAELLKYHFFDLIEYVTVLQED